MISSMRAVASVGSGGLVHARHGASVPELASGEGSTLSVGDSRVSAAALQPPSAP